MCLHFRLSESFAPWLNASLLISVSVGLFPFTIRSILTRIIRTVSIPHGSIVFLISLCVWVDQLLRINLFLCLIEVILSTMWGALGSLLQH